MPTRFSGSLPQTRTRSPARGLRFTRASISSASGSDQEAKRLLVDKPYEATFGRKMGDFHKLKEIKDRP